VAKVPNISRPSTSLAPSRLGGRKVWARRVWPTSREPSFDENHPLRLGILTCFQAVEVDAGSRDTARVVPSIPDLLVTTNFAVFIHKSGDQAAGDIMYPASNVRTVSSLKLMDTLEYNDLTRGVYHDRE